MPESQSLNKTGEPGDYPNSPLNDPGIPLLGVSQPVRDDSADNGLANLLSGAEQGRYRFDSENHIHLLDGGPLYGTSTICSEGLPKPGLLWWAVGCALTPLGWLNKRKSTVAEREKAAIAALGFIGSLSRRGFMDFLQKCYTAHKEKKEAAAGPGTEMHYWLEKYIKECIDEYEGKPVPAKTSTTGIDPVRIFSDWAVENVKTFLWSERHCYSERLWTGGICDCGAILKDDGLAIIDFKSAKEAFASHFIQAGGYAVAIQENGLFTADGEAVSTGIRHVEAKALIVFPFGGTGEPGIRHNVKDFKNAFEGAVAVHKVMKQEEKYARW